jgi:DNA replication protein DnaD
MEGWISLYRQIIDNWIWKSNEPFDKRSAWISLLLKANHKDTKVVINSEVVEVKKGSFITSEIKLSEEWKWGRKKVRNFLKSLEDDRMLTKNSTTKYTTISIENWDLYQNKEQQKNNKGTAEEQQRNTDNNDNNIYLYLFNKYKAKIQGSSFAQKIRAINECRNEEQYALMNLELQEKLFYDLQSLK